MNEIKFTEEEWNNCIKVLSILKNDPFDNPDNQLISGLISKIYKKARKNIRDSDYEIKQNQDLETRRKSIIHRNALEGKTSYFDDNKQYQNYTRLNIPKNCYCCNQEYHFLNSFYDRLCPECAEEHYENRFQNVDLKGRNVILTGGRVKVGYATALKLLRNGANVILTTRFPAIALDQLIKEDDYKTWKHRLWIYGLDLRNLHAIQQFIDFYKKEFNTLDILINNAAQTIKYDNEYYLPIIEKEKQTAIQYREIKNLYSNETDVSINIKQLEQSLQGHTEVALNRFGQPIDYRNKNSWNSTLQEVSLVELLEVNLINHIAPYFLIKELKETMKNSTFKDRFIINVTSSEGIFSYENKTIFHPHTNMTKAALNMLTLTSASEFANDQIYMSAVDVGWISTGAHEKLREKQFSKGYIPPLDSVDGASRILHPIIEGINGNPIFGKLLKNYKVHTW